MICPSFVTIYDETERNLVFRLTRIKKCRPDFQGILYRRERKALSPNTDLKIVYIRVYFYHNSGLQSCQLYLQPENFNVAQMLVFVLEGKNLSHKFLFGGYQILLLRHYSNIIIILIYFPNKCNKRRN